MRKIQKIVFILLSTSLLFCSCSNNTAQNDEEKEALKSQIEALQSQMEIITEADTSKTSVEELEKEEGYWVIRSYKDKYGEETDDKYITNKDYIIGSFNNSATSNSDLNVVLSFKKTNIVGILTISLYEYGDQLVKNANSSSKRDNIYAVFFKTSSSNTEWLCKGVMPAGSDRIIIDSESNGHEYLNGYDTTDIGATLCLDKIDKFLKASKDEIIKVYIEEVDNPITNYSFSIKSENYKEIYNEINNIRT